MTRPRQRRHLPARRATARRPADRPTRACDATCLAEARHERDRLRARIGGVLW